VGKELEIFWTSACSGFVDESTGDEAVCGLPDEEQEEAERNVSYFVDGKEPGEQAAEEAETANAYEVPETREG